MSRKNYIFALLGLFPLFYIYYGYFYGSDSSNILLENKKYQQFQTIYSMEKSVTLTETGYNTPTLHNEENLISDTKSFNNSLVIFPNYNSTNLTFIAMQQENLWTSWVKSHEFISVGRYYNHCEDDKIVTGEFVMVPNSDSHRGVKFQSYLNVTWGETVTSGIMYVNIWFGKFQFLKYETALCTKRKSFKCPLEKDVPHNYSVEFTTPFYVPSGRYRAKVYAENDEKKVVLCFFAEAII